MIKLKEYFNIPKSGKIQEKVLFSRIALSVALIAVCISMTVITAYAYFSASVTSATNTIQAANYSLEIKINDENVELGKDLVLNSGSHKVTINKTGSASTGFCIITVNGDTVYHTQQIGKYLIDNTEHDDPTITFTLKLNSDATVKFTANWGTSSFYDKIDNNETFNIPATLTAFYASADNYNSASSSKSSDASTAEQSDSNDSSSSENPSSSDENVTVTDDSSSTVSGTSSDNTAASGENTTPNESDNGTENSDTFSADSSASSENNSYANNSSVTESSSSTAE